MSPLNKLFLIVAGQTILLGSMIVNDSLPYLLGDTIRLQVEPVDPRDFFRGDYVILRYDFHRLTRENATWSVAEITDKTKVFIALKPAKEGDYWVTDSIALRPPLAGPYLRGNYIHGRLATGIEAYYVQEGQGRKIEKAIAERRRVFAEVAVWNGTAKLKRVMIK